MTDIGLNLPNRIGLSHFHTCSDVGTIWLAIDLPGASSGIHGNDPIATIPVAGGPM